MLFALALLACGPGPVPKGDPQRPDVILISIDTLRADHLSSYGNPRPTSPFIDSLAAKGKRFTHARSPSPWTLPAHTTLLTGQLPATHKVVDDNLRLDPSTSVLPEVMRSAGYATFGSVGTLYVSRLFGFERGFDQFEDFGIKTEKVNLSGSVDAEDVFGKARKMLGKLPEGKPFFLFLHVYDVHYHYDPPGKYGTMFDRAPSSSDPKFTTYFRHKDKGELPTPEEFEHQLAQYDESIRYVDDQLAKLGEAVKHRDVRWVVTADHGEEFGERGSWGHAHTLYAEQLHIPLVVSGPGIEPEVVDDVVGLQDVAVTVAGWAGKTLPEADGVDLVSGRTPRPMLGETSRFKTSRVSLYEDGLRMEWDLKSGKVELFDPTADPKERVDLALTRRDDVDRMRARVQQLVGGAWEAKQPGTVTVKKGKIIRGGAISKSLQVFPGNRFTVLPYDAKVTFDGQGPWQAAGGTAPGADAPLALLGKAGPAGAELDAETRKALEALGYIQQ